MSGIINTTTTEWRKATQDNLTSCAMKKEVVRIIREEGGASEFLIKMMLGAFYKQDVTRFLPGILDQLVRTAMVVRDAEAMYSLHRE